MPPSTLAEYRGFGRGLVQSGRARQVHLDRRAVAFLAVDLDVAARLLDEAEHHAEPEAGALADLLGGEEGIEHPLDEGGGDAGAGVAHGDHHIIARRDLAVHAGVVFVEIDVAGLERELAAIGHGIARVEGKIENRRRELVRVDQRRPGVLGQQRRDLDVFAERRVQQFGGLQHQRIDVDFARLQRLLAGKGQQMLGQIGAAFGGLVDQPGDGDEFGLVGDGFVQDADGAGDHGQDVVEVVRDAAGQLADRVHLLDMPQLGFRRLLLRQVAADEEMPFHRLRPRAGPVQRNGRVRPCGCSGFRNCAIACRAVPRASRCGCFRDRRDG